MNSFFTLSKLSIESGWNDEGIKFGESIKPTEINLLDKFDIRKGFLDLLHISEIRVIKDGLRNSNEHYKYGDLSILGLKVRFNIHHANPFEIIVISSLNGNFETMEVFRHKVSLLNNTSVFTQILHIINVRAGHKFQIFFQGSPKIKCKIKHLLVEAVPLSPEITKESYEGKLTVLFEQLFDRNVFEKHQISHIIKFYKKIAKYLADQYDPKLESRFISYCKRKACEDCNALMYESNNKEELIFCLNDNCGRSLIYNGDYREILLEEPLKEIIFQFDSISKTIEASRQNIFHESRWKLRDKMIENRRRAIQIACEERWYEDACYRRVCPKCGKVEPYLDCRFRKLLIDQKSTHPYKAKCIKCRVPFVPKITWEAALWEYKTIQFIKKKQRHVNEIAATLNRRASFWETNTFSSKIREIQPQNILGKTLTEAGIQQIFTNSKRFLDDKIFDNTTFPHLHGFQDSESFHSEDPPKEIEELEKFSDQLKSNQNPISVEYIEDINLNKQIENNHESINHEFVDNIDLAENADLYSFISSHHDFSIFSEEPSIIVSKIFLEEELPKSEITPVIVQPPLVITDSISSIELINWPQSFFKWKNTFSGIHPLNLPTDELFLSNIVRLGFLWNEQTFSYIPFNFSTFLSNEFSKKCHDIRYFFGYCDRIGQSSTAIFIIPKRSNTPKIHNPEIDQYQVCTSSRCDYLCPPLSNTQKIPFISWKLIDYSNEEKTTLNIPLNSLFTLNLIYNASPYFNYKNYSSNDDKTIIYEIQFPVRKIDPSDDDEELWNYGYATYIFDLPLKKLDQNKEFQDSVPFIPCNDANSILSLNNKNKSSWIWNSEWNQLIGPISSKIPVILYFKNHSQSLVICNTDGIYFLCEDHKSN